jgi:hypothetical protein
MVTTLEKRADMVPLVRQILAHLPGWTINDGANDWDHVVTLAGPEGQGLYINGVHGGKGKLHISGVYPKDRSNNCYGRSVIGYNSQPPSINVAASRGAKAIAGDIARRLLPEYREIFWKALERKATTDAYIELTRATAERLAAAGVELRGEYKDQLHLYRSHGAYMDGNVGGDSVTMNFRGLTPDQAEAIIKIVKG